jgi:hypothetical protein
MRTTFSPYRHPVLHEIEPEMPLLIVGACLLAVTITAVYMYAATL